MRIQILIGLTILIVACVPAPVGTNIPKGRSFASATSSAIPTAVFTSTLTATSTIQPTATFTPSLTATFKPPATATAQMICFKIMPLGDSITFGEGALDYGGYRNLLGVLLANDGYRVDFVGSQQTGMASIPDPDNEGHPGWKIFNIKDAIDSEGWLEIYQPDVILLHIGTNDINRGYAASAPENLSALLDDILLRLPEIHIIVAQIIPYSSGPLEEHIAYNAAIPGIVESKGQRVSMVDMQNILSQDDYADIYHPNDEGYDKMARAWETAILALETPSDLTCSPK
jgi:lysophospholipase L1-like esterase